MGKLSRIKHVLFSLTYFALVLRMIQPQQFASLKLDIAFSQPSNNGQTCGKEIEKQPRVEKQVDDLFVEIWFHDILLQPVGTRT